MYFGVTLFEVCSEYSHVKDVATKYFCTLIKTIFHIYIYIYVFGKKKKEFKKIVA